MTKVNYRLLYWGRIWQIISVVCRCSVVLNTFVSANRVTVRKMWEVSMCIYVLVWPRNKQLNLWKIGAKRCFLLIVSLDQKKIAKSCLLLQFEQDFDSYAIHDQNVEARDQNSKAATRCRSRYWQVRFVFRNIYKKLQKTPQCMKRLKQNE